VTVRTRRFLVIAVLAGVFGVGVAVAGGDLSSNQDAFLNDVAKRLNVTPDQLKAAIKGATNDRIDQAVKDGKITKEQGDALKKRAADGGVPFLGPALGGLRPGPGFHFGGRGFGFGHRGGASLDAAAKYLGLTEEQLRTQLAAGKSLADIAGDKSKSVDGLKKAMTADLQAKLDQAVKDKKLTQAQADEILKRTNDLLDDLVNGKFEPGMRFGHKGFGGPMGMHPSGARIIVPMPNGQPI